MSERRAIIARRLVQAASAVITLGSPILLPHEAAERKKILWKVEAASLRSADTRGGCAHISTFDYLRFDYKVSRYRLGGTIRIIPGRRTAMSPLLRLRAATVVL